MESCALIPSYRPDGRLIQTIAALKEAGFERIVVVDDGSGAEFAPLFSQAERDYSAVVLRHTVNMGKGRALKTGFCWILARYPSCCAVSVDGDGQHSAESAVAAAELAEANPDALILGCRRFARQKSMPIPNLIGNVATRAAFFLLTGIRFADTQCGLRAYTPGVMRLLCNVAGDRFEFESNTLLAVRKLHLPVIEFGLEVLYAPAGEYVSTYRRATDSARIARCLLDFALLPLLFGLISSVLLLCFTAAGAAAALNGTAAFLCVLAGKLLLALVSPRKLLGSVYACSAAALYGLCFFLLCAASLPPAGAFALLLLPYSLVSFALYRLFNFGFSPRLLRFR